MKDLVEYPQVLIPPVVVNLRRGEEFDQYIGVGTVWGNPFAMPGNGLSRKASIQRYEGRLVKLLDQPGMLLALKGLSGKRLGCHCAPRPCHGDIIRKVFVERFLTKG